MTISESRSGERFGLHGESRWFGMYTGVVTDIVDPDGQGRVRVRLPWAPDSDGAAFEAWCRLVTPMAGPDRGIWFIPEVEDEVAVAFEGGDPRRPFLLGGFWNGVDAPPEQMDGAGENNIRSITSRAGIRLTMDDSDGAVTVTLQTPGGQRVELRDGQAGCTLEDSNGNRVVLEAAGITVQTSGTLRISASTVDVSAGSVAVNSGISTFSGVAKSDTVITNSVVSASYTPGAGNIW